MLDRDVPGLMPEEHIDLPEHRLKRSGMRIRRPLEPEQRTTPGEEQGKQEQAEKEEQG